VAKSFWESLSSDDRTALASAAADGARHFDELIVRDEVASMARAKAEGGRLFKPDNRAEWEAGARKVWASLAPKLGGIDKIEAVAGS
jgi:TRAP-type C4-dicarboxylate transport system substrate-binding protein